MQPVTSVQDLIEIEKLNWPTIEDRLADGHDTVIFACGAVEQHGPHLPLFADAEHGTELAKAIASRLGKTLVAPTIRVGCSDHHMGFKGTLSLRATTLRAICEDYVDSLAAHGFRRILIVPSHGGNFGPITEMLPDLNQRADGVDVLAFTDLIGFIEVWQEVIRSELGLEERVGGHADIAESSIILSLHPELVAVDRVAPGFIQPVSQEALAHVFEKGLAAVSPTGVLGDARGMAPWVGRVCVERVADMIADSFASASSS